jgi:transmembrane sensor
MDNQFEKYTDEQAHRIAYLVAGYIKGTISKNEHDELDEWICENDENMELFEKLTDEKNIGIATRLMQKMETEQVLEEKKKVISFNKSENKTVWIKSLPYVAAACIILIVGLIVLKPFTKKGTPVVVNNSSDILPGSNQAILTLEDGKVVILSQDKKDTAINEQVKILRQEGEIVYTGQTTNEPMKYHTLNVPRKGQYKLVLPDGTKVWINAESSIRYPVAFDDKERRVFITGEAYFEVAKNKTKPFRVVVNDIVVEAVGTAFNVNAYSNEPYLSATLIEGSVLVSNGKTENLLTPGQQARISETDFTITAIEANDVVAWKDNRFNFVNTPLDVIMRQIERWYDATVVYETMPADHFNAVDVPRDVPVSKLLHFLELTKRVHFKIENNKIIVMK